MQFEKLGFTYFTESLKTVAVFLLFIPFYFILCTVRVTPSVSLSLFNNGSNISNNDMVFFTSK